MSGNIPNILIIVLALVTYGSLAFLIMRFALREHRPETTGVARTRTLPLPVRPTASVLAALQREAALDAPREMQPASAPRASSPQARESVGVS